MENDIKLNDIIDDNLKRKFYEICYKFKALNYFSYINTSFLNIETKELNFLHIDLNKYLDFYRNERFILIDPVMDLIFYTNRDIICFEELNYKELVNENGKIYNPGKIINAHKASNKYCMLNGFYTVLRLKSKYMITGSYGIHSKNFKIEKFFDNKYAEGKWFSEYTKQINFLLLNAINKKEFEENNFNKIIH